MREFAHRDFWGVPADSAEPQPMRLTIEWPEPAGSEGWWGGIAFTSDFRSWSKRQPHHWDSMSALVFQPFFAHCCLCGWQNFVRERFWWREPGDLDTLAFWAASPHSVVEVREPPAQPVGEADGWWLHPPNGEPPVPLSAAFGAPELGMEGDYEASLWIKCPYFTWGGKVRGADGVQALMSMRAAAEACMAPWLAKGYRMNLTDEPDFHGMEYYHFWGNAPE